MLLINLHWNRLKVLIVTVLVLPILEFPRPLILGKAFWFWDAGCNIAHRYDWHLWMFGYNSGLSFIFTCPVHSHSNCYLYWAYFFRYYCKWNILKPRQECLFVFDVCWHLYISNTKQASSLPLWNGYLLFIPFCLFVIPGTAIHTVIL